MILHSKTENELVYMASAANDFDLGLIEENLADKNTDFVKILIPDGVQPNLELLNPLSKKYVVNLLMYGIKTASNP